MDSAGGRTLCSVQGGNTRSHCHPLLWCRQTPMAPYLCALQFGLGLDEAPDLERCMGCKQHEGSDLGRCVPHAAGGLAMCSK